MNNNFNKIYELGGEFFNKIIELYRKNAYDYLILTTRRCFCLFYALFDDKVFEKNFILNLSVNDRDILEKIKSCAISSQKVNVLGQDIENKKVLLLDDVMIHGHALHELYKTTESYNPDILDTLVLIRNIEWPDYYFSSTKKEYYYVEKLLNYEWRKISNLIIKYLHHQGHSYTSYVYGIETLNSIIDESIEEKNALIEIPLDFNELETYQEYKMDRYPQYYSVRNFNYNFIDQVLIRRYKPSKDNDKSIIVPYIQLKDMNEETLNTIWDNLCKTENTINKLSDFISIEDRYKVLTAICCICLYQKLFGSISNFNNIVDRSFKSDFLKVISDDIFNDIFDIIQNSYTAIETDNRDLLMSNCFFKAKNNYFTTHSEKTMETVDFLSVYFYLVTETEDLMYEKNCSNYGYMKPIFYSKFLKLLNNSDFTIDNNYINAILMYFSDIGIISYVTQKNSANVGTALKTGEQSYHLFKKISGDAYKAVYVLLNYINTLHKESEKEIFKEKFTKNLTEEIMISEDTKNRIRFFLYNPPAKVNESYFGVLDEVNSSKDKEKIANANFILNAIIKIMEKSCDGMLIL